MDGLWIVALDTARLRAALVGRLLVMAEELPYVAGRVTGVRVLSACAIPSGLRIVARAASPKALRRFNRRLVALLAAKMGRAVRWRARACIRAISPGQCQTYLDYVARCRSSMLGDTQVTRKRTNNDRTAVRRAARMLPLIERSNAALLGEDEVATRIRRYVAAHETPTDDRAGFARLCDVIFAQGLGFAAVEKHRAQLESAFCGYAPGTVAQIDTARIASRLSEPVIRDRHKIEACIESAQRWNELAATHGSYLGRVAQIAAGDDAVAGWPTLIGQLQHDFNRLREPTTRVLLKHWGFFTANTHPGTRRLLVRLGMLDASTDGPSAQRFVAAVAQAASADPYAIEATLAIFAGAGPCQVEPRCVECALSDSCPTGAQTKSGTETGGPKTARAELG